MQGIRKYALVVCLAAAVVLGAAAHPSPRTSRYSSLDDSIITQILELLGIVVDESRVSTPPG
jgi:hypothetical protein